MTVGFLPVRLGVLSGAGRLSSAIADLEFLERINQVRTTLVIARRQPKPKQVTHTSHTRRNHTAECWLQRAHNGQRTRHHQTTSCPCDRRHLLRRHQTVRACPFVPTALASHCAKRRRQCGRRQPGFTQPFELISAAKATASRSTRQKPQPQLTIAQVAEPPARCYRDTDPRLCTSTTRQYTPHRYRAVTAMPLNGHLPIQTDTLRPSQHARQQIGNQYTH